MASDFSITYLPNELVEYILQSGCLSANDVCSFAATCSKFRNLIVGNNKLWKIKFQQLWPDLQSSGNGREVKDWEYEFKTRLRIGWRVRQLLSEMSPKFYRKEDISHAELEDFWTLVDEHPLAYNFIISELMAVLYDYNVISNLTVKYYAERVVRLVRQAYLSEEWRKFVELPAERQVLELGATFVAQWCQPLVEVSYSDVAAQLDKIAARCCEVLQTEHPSHPLLSCTAEELRHLRDMNITDNRWRPAESHQALDALRRVLFQEMCFSGNSSLYYSAENSYIDKVLEMRRGIPVTLSILFESVARRLGVRCEPVSFPAHFLLRWRDHYSEDSPLELGGTYYYIDVFNGGQFLTKRSCPRYSPDAPCPLGRVAFKAATAQQVVERMANNLEVAGRQRTHSSERRTRMRSNLELLHLVSPYDLGCILHLARYYMLYNMDLAGLTDTLRAIHQNMEPRQRDQAEHIMQMLQVYETHRSFPRSPPQIEQKMRCPTVTFAVGMLMKHRLFNYHCVIYGWDPLCMESKEWIEQMGVDNLANKANQPFYNVLVEDGSTRYAAQENLEMFTEPTEIAHSEIGRYFDCFCVTYYRPNAEKAYEYPQDTEVRERLLLQARGQS